MPTCFNVDCNADWVFTLGVKVDGPAGLTRQGLCARRVDNMTMFPKLDCTVDLHVGVMTHW